MYQSTATARTTTPPFVAPSAETAFVAALNNDSDLEVLEFLSRRPIHNVGMIGFIRDNGLVSKLNRGTFYGYRNGMGELEGVALIGHATLMEIHTEEAVRAFADVARTATQLHLIMGEQIQIERFWTYYCRNQSETRRVGREVLYQLNWPVPVHDEIKSLRAATADEIELIVPVHARLAFEESGINPLESDPEGFRQRCARRIEQGRTWVLVENGKLVFKAEVVADTPEVVYLEGIWVSEDKRMNGYGVRCLSQLGRKLLQHTKSVSLLANESNKAAQALYERAGFKPIGLYESVFV